MARVAATLIRIESAREEAVEASGVASYGLGPRVRCWKLLHRRDDFCLPTSVEQDVPVPVIGVF